jgi:plastocyanin
MAQTHSIDITNMAFNPGSVTISVGDTVEWTNLMGMDHTVTPDNSEFPSSGHIKPKAKFSHIFGASGSFAYHCEIHPFMKGTVIVA